MLDCGNGLRIGSDLFVLSVDFLSLLLLLVGIGVFSYFNLLFIKKGRIFMKKKMFLLGFIGGAIGSITSHIITAIL